MSKPKPEEARVQMPLRVPASLKNRLDAWSELQKISLNQACADLLDHALRVRGQ